MAFASDSTTAPARPLLPVRDARGRFVKLAAEPRAELPPEPLLRAADRARAIHLRRQLEAAAEHGADLLSALGLPRLVTGEFIQVDPAAAGDALDLAIATLDALDADPDIEDGADDEATGDDELSLGWREGVKQLDLGHGSDDAEPSLASPERHPRVPDFAWGPVYTARGGEEGQLRWAEGARDDREAVVEDGPIDDDELDGAGEVDAEHSLGWAANASQLRLYGSCEFGGELEHTAPERAGRGFVRSGPDDAEDDDPAEDDDGRGDEDSGIGDEDRYYEQCGLAVAGALPWSAGGYVA